MKDSLPFAPFLIASALIALIWGQYFIDWYFGYFRI
jgi:prepilin signal peptidase PulO-like enzyme (type II secretory pathway)